MSTRCEIFFFAARKKIFIRALTTTYCGLKSLQPQYVEALANGDDMADSVSLVGALEETESIRCLPPMKVNASMGQCVNEFMGAWGYEVIDPLTH